MPSNRQSWWARHCTPPPPISASSACPCGKCYSKATRDAAQRELSMQQQLQIQQLQQQLQQQQQHVQGQHREDQVQAIRTVQYTTQRSDNKLKAWGSKPLRMMGSLAPLLRRDSDSVSISGSVSGGSIYHLEHAHEQ